MKKMHLTLSLVIIILSGGMLHGMTKAKGNKARQNVQNLDRLLENQKRYYAIYTTHQGEASNTATFQKYALSLEYDKLQCDQIADEDLGTLAQWVDWADINFPDTSSHKQVSQSTNHYPSTTTYSNTAYNPSTICKVAPWVLIGILGLLCKTVY